MLKEFLEDFGCSEVELVSKHIASYCVGEQADQCSSERDPSLVLRVVAGLLVRDFSIEYASRDWELNSWTSPNSHVRIAR